MIRLTAIVSGKVQEVGYRARVVDIANAFGLKGMIENLKDGRVKIIAEGEDEKLKWFEFAIDIKNTLISVSAIIKTYSPATGDFENFGKLVTKGETDSRLDTAAVYLKEIVVSVNKMNDNLGGKMDTMIAKQDQMLDKQDQMLDKQDQMLDKQDQMLDKQDTTIGEIRALRTDLKGYMDMRFKRIEADLSELKDMKVALKEKGLI
ncbi:MAG TPA: acylphosphatase [Methanothrix sp.]|nr:acylphosphatase [Methanothrix sp.]HQQ37016.1 acylphosphatase [Methanothrix sp.]